MRELRNFLAFVVIATSVVTVSARAEMSAREIMEKQRNLHKVATEVEVQKMMLVDKSGNKETREIKRFMKEAGKDVYRSLVVFSAPSDIKGTALLNWQHKKAADDQWLYLPAQGKMQRIAEGGKKNYFMGTDFTYEDLQSEDIDAFDYKKLREEACDDQMCYVIEAVASSPEKKKETAYSKRILWIRKDIVMAVKTEYYDRRNKLVKTQISSELENVKGSIWRAKKGLMDNQSNGHKTVIMVADRKINDNISDQTFTERFVLSGNHIR